LQANRPVAVLVPAADPMSALAVYPAAIPESIAWPERVESLSRHLGRHGVPVTGARRGDVSLTDRLFMAALVALPRQERYGAVSRLASLLGASRQMVYDVAERVFQQVGASGVGGRPARFWIPPTGRPSIRSSPRATRSSSMTART